MKFIINKASDRYNSENIVEINSLEELLKFRDDYLE